MDKKGLLIILSGPSGVGKGTILKEIMSDDSCALSISATTRAPREGELEGVNYFFKTQEEFQKMIEKNQLLEYAEFCGNFYGTPVEYVDSMLEQGKNVILEIEVQGALDVKKKRPEAVSVFISPPSFEELFERLKGRATEDMETIENRINRAKEEIKFIPQYDYEVINDRLENAIEEVKQILKSESEKE